MAHRLRDNGACLRQVTDLKKKYPNGYSSWRCGMVTWRGQLQPTLNSRTYTVQITWDGSGRRPAVDVLRPLLQPPTGTRLQHVFADGRLCLHFTSEWHPGMLISETIIPWASEWLYFHELWLATGEWHGGGHNPSPKAPETPSKSEQGVDAKHHAM